MAEYCLPAIRGLFGDWVYYSCLMPMADVVERIRFASEVHKNKGLSDMIQRKLKAGRSKEIADYLSRQEQRFFNSLVIAVYGGSPAWHALGNIKGGAGDVDLSCISRDAEDSVGFLRFTGEENLFALDGQHRLAGMREALSKDNDELAADEVPLILVAHSEDEVGRARTRRLFTTLNKTPRPVGKGEIIALDENDAMAIVTRYLVEDSTLFGNDRVRFVQADNLPPTNTSELTTIGNLYDVLACLFTQVMRKGKKEELRFFRPSDSELEEYTRFTVTFFEYLAETYAPLAEYFGAAEGTQVIEKYRRSDGGHLLFRPVGLKLVVELVGALVGSKLDWQTAVQRVADLPSNLSVVPFRDVIWLPGQQKMNPGKRVLARGLCLHMLGYGRQKEKLRERYAKQLGIPIAECTLPSPLK